MSGSTPAREGTRRAPGRSALRVVPEPTGAASVRADQREMFALRLRTDLSRRGTPYSSRTIGAYLDAVDSLARWLTEVQHPAGFDDVTVGGLNTYLATYHSRHGQNGTVTKQQNLRVFLRFLAEEYEAEDLWLHPKRRRYQRREQPPAVLDPAMIRALLKVTAGRSFEDRRDHAIIRILIGGVRREEVARLQVEHLDLRSQYRSAAVVGLMGAIGRRVPLGDGNVLALRRWLGVRGKHRRVTDSGRGPLWIADRTGDRLKPDGIYQMLRRRARQAGYPVESIRPHLFRHTFAHECLASGGSEADLMALAGWTDRPMVLRYGASMSEQRAHEAVAVEVQRPLLGPSAGPGTGRRPARPCPWPRTLRNRLASGRAWVIGVGGS